MSRLHKEVHKKEFLVAYLLDNLTLIQILHTANVYRELQGYYREITLQGFHIYRDIHGMRLLIIITIILVVKTIGILSNQHFTYI